MLPQRVHLRRLRAFRRALGLDATGESPLAAYAAIFLPLAESYAERMYADALATPQLRLVLESLGDGGGLKRKWAAWFSGLFSRPLDDAMLERLWRSGQAHVERDLDHRQISLAYSRAREFLHRAAMDALGAGELAGALHILDKVLDFCLLVETDAYVTYTSRCELVVIEGVEHQLRNPIAVIAGQGRKLLRLRGDDKEVAESAAVVIEEVMRLERLASKVSAYMIASEGEADGAEVSVGEILEAVLSQEAVAPNRPVVVVDIAPDAAATVMAKDDLYVLLSTMLGNAFQFADQTDPKVTVACRSEPHTNGYSVLSVDNNGHAFSAGDLKHFQPFHSSLPGGTGMGLALARRILDKYSGVITLSPLPGGGARCAATLPVAPPDSA